MMHEMDTLKSKKSGTEKKIHDAGIGKGEIRHEIEAWQRE